jgi:hypothetical protein
MRFGMDVMPSESTLNRTFQFPVIGKANMAGERTCEVGSTLALLYFRAGSWHGLGG